MTYVIFLCLFFVCVEANTDAQQDFSSRMSEIVRRVNSDPNSTWKASLNNRFQSFDDVRRHLGALHEDPVEKRQRRPTVRYNSDGKHLPTEFDSRAHWPMCIDTIAEIRDQSSCGSCWAFGAVEAMSDRLCIKTGGKINVTLSALDLLSCCHDCGDGCEGGYPGIAWDFWKNNGIVTGDSKENPTGCKPYPFPSCTHHGAGTKPPCPKKLYDTPRCLEVCTHEYKQPYTWDKYFAISSYNVHNQEEDIMTEIMNNGPVEAAFDVYPDFLAYEKGIYKHTGEKPISGHAIRIVGWGVDAGTKYWRIANSWNSEWGENGYFRILRGSNECGIESEVVAGDPLL